MIAAALVLALVAFVLYETLVKEQINATAKDAAAKVASSVVESAVSSIASDAAAANANASDAQNQASQANSNASDAKNQASKANSRINNGENQGNNTSPSGGLGPSNKPVANGQATSFTLQGDKAETPGNLTSFGITDGPAIKKHQFLVITAMIMQNPDGDNGTMEIRRGSDTLLREGLQNFRDQDFHFDDEPLIFLRSAPLTLAVNCQKAGAPATTCQPSILFTGRVVDTSSPSPTPTPSG